ncbi:MAG TPA: hypothetical protein VK859_00875, partial [bacterium]|nr:hypothetical protein [bacterium]
NYVLIDDFEGTGGAGSDSVANLYAIQDQSGNWRDGYWYAASDGSTVISSGTGDPGTAIEYNTTFGSYAQLAFSFINPGGAHYSASVTTYDATVGGRYYGISFSAKANSLPATICTSTMPMWVDFVDNNATAPDHVVAVPVTMGWQNYTIYFDQAGFDAGLDGNSVALNPVSIVAVKFEPQGLGTAAFHVDFLIDNVQLVSTTDPAPPTAISSKLINDFESGINQNVTNASGKFYAPTTTGRPGYWFVFCDTEGTGTAECPNGAVNGSVFFPDSPGYGGTAGDPGFAAHITGTVGTNGNTNGGMYPYLGLGTDFVSSTTSYDTTPYTGISFYGKVDAGTATGIRVGFPTPDGVSDGNDVFQEQETLSTTWTQFTIPLTNPPLAQQGFGPSKGTEPWTPNQVYGIQWEFDNGDASQTVGLWVDNVTFY